MTSLRLFLPRVFLSMVTWLVSTAMLMAKEPLEPPAGQIESLWTCLAKRDAVKAHKAMRQLVELQDTTVCFLEERMIPFQTIEPTVQILIQELDDNQFQARERASRKLAEMGVLAETLLADAMKNSPSAEVRSRAGQLFKRLQHPVISDPHQLRTIRAISILEQIGSKSAKNLIAQLSVPCAIKNNWQSRNSRTIRTNLAVSTPTRFNEHQLSANFSQHGCVEHKARVFDVDFSPNSRF